MRALACMEYVTKSRRNIKILNTKLLESVTKVLASICRTISFRMSFSCWGCRYGKYIIYRRYVIAMMVSWAIVVLLGIKRAPRMAITVSEMQIKLPNNNSTDEKTKKGNYTTMIKLDWTQTEIFYVDLSFSIAYMLAHIPSGIICDIYGSKYMLSTGVLVSSVAVVGMPWAMTNTSWIVTAMLQFLSGIGQGMCMPAIMSLLSKWSPRNQRSFIVSYAFSGFCLSPAIQVLVVSFFYNISHWQGFFYFWTIMGLIWYLVALYVVFSHPSKDPFICFKEKELLEKDAGLLMPKKIPWKSLLKCSGVWALLIGEIGHNCLMSNVDIYLPRFFHESCDIVIQGNFFTYILPYVCQVVGLVTAGLLADYLIRRRYVPITYLRTIYAVIGCIVPSCLTIISTYAGCSLIVLLTIFITILILRSAIYPAFKANMLDLTSHYCGCVMAIQNGLPSLTSAITPQIRVYMIKDNTTLEWRKFFSVWGIVNVFTTSMFMVWVTGDKAKWDVITDLEDDKKIKKKQQDI